MTWKIILFEFERELTRSEEDTLIGLLCDLQDNVRKSFNRGKKILSNPLLRILGGNNTFTETIKLRIQFVLDNLNELMRLEKRGPGQYAFMLQWSTLDLTALVPTLPGGLGKKDTWKDFQVQISGPCVKDIQAHVKLTPKVSFSEE